MSLKLRLLSLVLASFGITGCLVSEDSQDLFTGSNSEACRAAIPVAFDTISISFEIPENALDFRVLREGSSVFQTTNSVLTSHLDINLTPGQTYRYRCEAIVDRNVGFQQVGDELTVQLPSSIPPTFAGLESAILNGSDAADLTWSLTSDSILSHFKVFSAVGSVSNISGFPESELLQLVGTTTTVANLGDELTYSFRVSACNTSDICDSNTSIHTVTTPDTGAPQTIGATDVSIVSQQIILTAPWEPENGAIDRRTIYSAQVAVGTSCPIANSSLSSFTELNSVFVNNIADVPTRLTASLVPSEDTKYCFVVRDTDPSNNQETNTVVQTITVTDLTAPNFPNQVTLERNPGNVENGLIASWPAIINEDQDSRLGASEYILYISTVTSGEPQTSVCDSGNVHSVISASAYDSGDTVSVNINGLTSRSASRICLKARDSSGNVSVQSPQALQRTGDITAPTFSGVQSAVFNASLQTIDLSFIVPLATDLKNYKVNGIRTRGGSQTNVEIFKSVPPQSPGSIGTASFTLTELSTIEGDSWEFVVNACDDASDSPVYNTTDNCSNTAVSVSLIVPDATPPQNFSGIGGATAGPTHRSVEVSWSTPGDLSDYAGFRIYHVNFNGDLVPLESDDCECLNSDCQNNPKNSCIVDKEEGADFLTPSRSYNLYVSAYDSQSNETRSYIPHQGGGAAIRTSRTTDTLSPSFSTILLSSVDQGVNLTFDSANDTQDSSVQLTYEIYRKENSGFNCPATPNVGGACDNLTPYAQVLDAALPTAQNGRRVYTDSAVTNGVTYHYQVCAVDFAGNRQCQTGSTTSVQVQDVTDPEVTNAISQKKANGSSTWTVSFTVDDNLVEPQDLVLSVYKSPTMFFPRGSIPANPDIINADISRNALGQASFTDTGTPDVPSIYYTIEAEDMIGNKGYAYVRDMTPLPTIANVEWPIPIKANGQPTNGNEIQTAATKTITITGTNLQSIVGINEADTAANFEDVRHCITDNIVSQTDNEIVCTMVGRISSSTQYTLFLKDSFDRTLQHESGSPQSYCAYAVDNSITSINGLGTAADPYALCYPEHFLQIGRNADNPLNTRDYIGHFAMSRNLDFSGLNNFPGIPIMQAGEFFLNGYNYNINNLTIDTSATDGDSAFIKGCAGTYDGAFSFMEDVFFNGADVNTGDGKGAVVLLDKSCDWSTQPGVRFMNRIRVRNSNLYSNNTAGLIVAEFENNRDDSNGLDVSDSTIFTTTPNTNTAVGSVIGKLSGSAASGSLFLNAEVENVTIRPDGGLTTTGPNIGGVIGEISASRILLHNTQIINFDIIDGGENLGAAVGRVISGADDLNFTSVQVETNSSIIGESNIGGLIGSMEDVTNFSTNRINSFSFTRVAIAMTGNSIIGGAIGYMNNSSATLNFYDTNTANITASSTAVGGFVGQLINSTLTANGSVARNLTISAVSDVGGLIGYSDEGSLIFSEVAIGDSSIEAENNVGGLVGTTVDQTNINMNDIHVHDNVSITGDGSNAGGFFGNLAMAPAGSLILRRAMNLSSVFQDGVSNSTTGTFFGSYTPGSSVTLVSNFYKNDHGSGSISSNPSYEAVGEIQGINSSQISTQATFVGYDFNNIWDMRANEPQLKITDDRQSDF